MGVRNSLPSAGIKAWVIGWYRYEKEYLKVSCILSKLQSIVVGDRWEFPLFHWQSLAHTAPDGRGGARRLLKGLTRPRSFKQPCRIIFGYFNKSGFHDSITQFYFSSECLLEYFFQKGFNWYLKHTSHDMPPCLLKIANMCTNLWWKRITYRSQIS